MKEILITSSFLQEFMDEEKYEKFIEKIRERLDTFEPIWIVAQVLDGKITNDK